MVIWLRLRKYLGWLWFKYVANRKGQYLPLLVDVVYGPDFETKAVFMNGRMTHFEDVSKCVLFLQTEKSDDSVDLGDWDITYQ